MMIKENKAIFAGTTYNLENPRRLKALLNRIAKMALWLDSVDNPEWDLRQNQIKTVCLAAGKEKLLEAGLEMMVKKYF